MARLLHLMIFSWLNWRMKLNEVPGIFLSWNPAVVPVWLAETWICICLYASFHHGLGPFSNGLLFAADLTGTKSTAGTNCSIKLVWRASLSSLTSSCCLALPLPLSLARLCFIKPFLSFYSLFFLSHSVGVFFFNFTISTIHQTWCD